ncbi:MAG TPA: YIP1 family protein [Pseudogracilibacillus sp.]|nr:YIP1 family protein [Pseudogracilibacillus sp.]
MPDDAKAYLNNCLTPNIFKMILEPKLQLQRIKQHPKVIFPLFLIVLISIMGFIFVAQGIDMINDNSEVLRMSEGELGLYLLFSQLIFAIIGFLTPIILIVFTSLIYYLIGKLLKSQASYIHYLSLMTFVSLPIALQIFMNGILFIVFGDIHGDYTMFTSLNILFGETGLLGGLLVGLEIFSIWFLILLALGLRIVAQYSRKATMITISLTIITSLLFSTFM